MDTRILTKIARDKYSVEKLIDKEIALIRQIKQTFPNSKRKRYKMDRKLRETSIEKNSYNIKLTGEIDLSQKQKKFYDYKVSKQEHLTNELDDAMVDEFNIY